MTNIITLTILVCMVSVPAFLNIIAYPISKKWSMRISNYIVKVCAPRIFKVLSCYKKFHFWGYRKTQEILPEKYMIISNHQSNIDIPVYMNFFRNEELRFVSKDTLARHIPLVSEMLRTQEHCMIPRKAKPMEAMKYMGQFGEKCRDRGHVPVLFPEGTRSKDGNVGKFYSAGFRKLTESTGLPVAVCVLDGGLAMRDMKQVFTHLQNGCYRVKVLKIYPCPKTKEECTQILDEARVLMQRQLEEWRKLPADVK